MDFGTRRIDFAEGAEPVSIVEIGVNHNGDMDLAKRMVRTVAESGGHVVKFQAFIAAEEISIHADKATYQKEATGSDSNQLEMAQALELDHQQLTEMRDYCRRQEMPFLFTAFESKSLEFLVKELQVQSIKVASSEITHHPFLAEIAQSGVGIILSTGASTLEETRAAFNVIRDAGCNDIVILHCVSEYPAKMDEINLRAMATIRDALDVPVGYSDHTSGIFAPIIAASMGACAVEKHFTLDRTMEGPDHRASIEPDELKLMIQGMHAAYISQGNGIKQPVPCELPQIPLIRKSIVARHKIDAGHTLSMDDLAFKRPLNGIEPFDLDKVLNRTIKVELEPDQPIQWTHFE